MHTLFFRTCLRAGKFALLLAVLLIALCRPQPAAASDLPQDAPLTPIPAPAAPVDPALDRSQSLPARMEIEH